MNKIKKTILKKVFGEIHAELESQKLLLGRLFSEKVREKTVVRSLADVEFKVFSQFGDDGIIQYLVNKLDIDRKIFIEFGVENYRESNTRFLLMNDNWSGLVMDSSADNIAFITREEWFWRHDLRAKQAFVTKENINQLIAEEGFCGEIGLLHIDIDGNDYWVWDAVDVVSPVIVIMEYNSIFGAERAVTIPYDAKFERTRAHHSNLFWGASLQALCLMGERKGYCFVGSNSAGNNAYFVRKDKLRNINVVSPIEGYVCAKFRESRNERGELTLASGEKRMELIKGMRVYNVKKDELESL